MRKTELFKRAKWNYEEYDLIVKTSQSTHNIQKRTANSVSSGNERSATLDRYIFHECTAGRAGGKADRARRRDGTYQGHR